MVENYQFHEKTVVFVKLYGRMSLKTKGLSPKTEAFCLDGGGENRTLVLTTSGYQPLRA